MQRMLRPLVAFLVVAAIVVTSYQFGYYSGAKSVPAATAPAATAAAPTAATPTAGTTPTSEAPKGFGTFWEAWNLVQGEFYRKDAVDYQKMTYGAIRGMIEALGDPYTAFVEPSSAKMSEEDIRGSFDGIGVTVEMRNDHVTVVAPLEDSPGEKAGIRAGDVIVKVDDKETAGRGLLEVVGLIRGPRGTTVQLTIARTGEAQPLVFEIVRAEIKTVTVRSQMMDGGIGYIKITQFSEPTAVGLQQELKKVMDGQPKAVVLDLRNNPGGLLTSAIEVASQFVGDGVVMYEERRDAPLQTFYARRGGLATSVPVVVLINKGSASASEIVAGALQDRGRAVLVGEASFGKDSVQNVHSLSDQSGLRITIAKWYTPNKQAIAGKGLTPDIVVPISEDDIKAGRDPQLERALERARTGS